MRSPPIPPASTAEKTSAAGPCRHKAESLRCLSCILDDSEYFSGLPLVAKLALQQALNIQSYGRRDTLYVEGKPSECLHILISGEVKVYKSLLDGRQQIHKVVSIPGDLLACEDLFLQSHSSTTVTLDETKVCFLRKNHLFEIMGQHRAIADTLIQSMARNLNAYIKHVANLGQKTALERVASYLVFLQETHVERNLRHGVLEVSLTRAELGEVLGVTQRTLIRSLKQLENTRLISLTKDGFVIHDAPALKRIGEAS